MSNRTRSSSAPTPPSSVTVFYRGATAAPAPAPAPGEDLWEHAKKTQHTPTQSPLPGPVNKTFAPNLKKSEQLRPLRDSRDPLVTKYVSPRHERENEKEKGTVTITTPAVVGKIIDYRKIGAGKSASAVKNEVTAAVINMNTPIRMMPRKALAPNTSAAFHQRTPPSSSMLTDEAEFPGLGGVPRKLVFDAV